MPYKKLFPLNLPREEDQENEGSASFFFEMWEVVISVAEQIPWTDAGQTRLVEAIQVLKGLPGQTTVQNGWLGQAGDLVGPDSAGTRNDGIWLQMRFIFSYFFTSDLLQLKKTYQCVMDDALWWINLIGKPLSARNRSGFSSIIEPWIMF